MIWPLLHNWRSWQLWRRTILRVSLVSVLLEPLQLKTVWHYTHVVKVRIFTSCIEKNVYCDVPFRWNVVTRTQELFSLLHWWRRVRIESSWRLCTPWEQRKVHLIDEIIDSMITFLWHMCVMHISTIYKYWCFSFTRTRTIHVVINSHCLSNKQICVRFGFYVIVILFTYRNQHWFHRFVLFGFIGWVRTNNRAFVRMMNCYMDCLELIRCRHISCMLKCPCSELRLIFFIQVLQCRRLHQPLRHHSMVRTFLWLLK